MGQELKQKLEEKHKRFNNSERKHILVITNHGCHSPTINVTTDTGGQNFYVNDLCISLVNLGYKVTILNRGGFNHPVTNKPHKGVVYYEDVLGEKGNFCRIAYLEDGISEFVEVKKFTRENLEKEKEHFFSLVDEIGLDLDNVLLINSHYWDGGVLGSLINQHLEGKRNKKIPHAWTPHELGRLLLKDNHSKDFNEIIKFNSLDERLNHEEEILSDIDAFVSTSFKISASLKEYKNKPKKSVWFPPGVRTSHMKPRKIEECKKSIELLMELTNKTQEEVIRMINENTLFFETSRTSKTKQKDMILKSFLKLKNRDSILVMNVDPTAEYYKELEEIHRDSNDPRVIFIDRYMTDEEKHHLFSLADVYITASLIEGWGMSVQEAAASGCAIIASKDVPFATEVLQDSALIVDEHSLDNYARKMDLLAANLDLTKEYAQMSYKKFMKEDFSWDNLSENMVLEVVNN